MDMLETTRRIMVGSEATRDLLIRAINEAIDAFGGSVQGDDLYGAVSVEFPTMGQAVDFTGHFDLAQVVMIDNQVDSFDARVVVRFSMVWFAWRVQVIFP